jgi:DNA adenine methylase
MKPILKWAGGKARLADQIAAAFEGPCQGTYYEPFMGSGAVFFHLKGSGLVRKAVLSDANSKLIATHIALRDDVNEVLLALESLPRKDWKERYYEVREAYNQGPFCGALHAARFLWLNRAGYNGLYRENRRGLFNVPIGRYASLRLPEPAHFYQISRLLQDTDLISASFEDILGKATEGDHIYCDPPYVPLSNTACFTGYCSLPFGMNEQELLAGKAQSAARAGATVVLSNHDLPVVCEELYAESKGFEHVARPQVARAISRGTRGSVAEVIAAIRPTTRLAA